MDADLWNSRANDGASPLFWRAAERGSYTSAKLLIKRGAPNRECITRWDYTLGNGVKNNHAPIVALLLENNAHTTLSDPDVLEDLDMIITLLEQSFGIREKDLGQHSHPC